MSRNIFILTICSLLTVGHVFAQKRKIISNVPYQSCDATDTVSISNIYLYRLDVGVLGDKEIKIYFDDSLLTTLKNNAYMVYVTGRKGPVKLKSEMDGKTSEVSFLVQPGRVYYIQSEIKGRKVSKLKPALHIMDPHYAYPYITDIRRNRRSE